MKYEILKRHIVIANKKAEKGDVLSDFKHYRAYVVLDDISDENCLAVTLKYSNNYNHNILFKVNNPFLKAPSASNGSLVVLPRENILEASPEPLSNIDMLKLYRSFLKLDFENMMDEDYYEFQNYLKKVNSSNLKKDCLLTIIDINTKEYKNYLVSEFNEEYFVGLPLIYDAVEGFKVSGAYSLVPNNSYLIKYNIYSAPSVDKIKKYIRG